MKLFEALELFLGEKDNPSTRETYGHILSRFLNWLGDKQPAEVESADILRYLQKVKPRLAEATLEKYKKTIRTFFYWLESIGEIEGRNPVKAVKQKRISNKVRKDKAIHEDELEKLLDFLQWHTRNYAIALFLAQTGCRAGGVSNLKIEDLHLEECYAWVTEKGDKTREVPFNNDCATAIRQWLIKRLPTDNTYVFTTDKGTQMSSAIISQTIRRACIKVGIRSLGTHAFRHRVGHRFAEAGVAPTIAASVLGHSDPTITLNNYYPDSWHSAEAQIRNLIQTPNNSQTKAVIHTIHPKRRSK